MKINVIQFLYLNNSFLILKMTNIYLYLIIFGSLTFYLYMIYIFRHRLIRISNNENINDEVSITNPIICTVSQ